MYASVLFNNSVTNDTKEVKTKKNKRATFHNWEWPSNKEEEEEEDEDIDMGEPINKSSFQWEGLMFLELFDYPSMQVIIQSEFPYHGFDIQEMIRIFGRQLACALDYVHSKNIVHNDIKPENILVKNFYDPKRMEIRLIDFGLCSSVSMDSQEPISTESRGTPYYSSLQKIKGKHNPFKSDVWAYGVTLYEVFYNNFPYDIAKSRTTDDITKCIKKGTMNRLPNLVHEGLLVCNINPDFENLLLGCLSKKEMKRFTMTDVCTSSFLLDQ